MVTSGELVLAVPPGITTVGFSPRWGQRQKQEVRQGGVAVPAHALT